MNIRQAALAITWVGAQSVFGEPQVEDSDPDLSNPPYQGAALEHFEAGNPPPFSSTVSIQFWTATGFTILEDDGSPPSHSYVRSNLYWEVYSTDGPLREIPPKIEDTEGLRILRNEDNPGFQIQGAGFVANIGQTENGWKVQQWKIEDTVAAENPSWRKPVAGVEPQAEILMLERSYDSKTLSRDFVRQFSTGGKAIDFTRFLVKDSGNITQTLMESYEGDTMNKNNLALRTRLKRTRVPGERQYQQIKTRQYFENGREGSSYPQKEIWEVDAQGVRRQIR